MVDVRRYALYGFKDADLFAKDSASTTDRLARVARRDAAEAWVRCPAASGRDTPFDASPPSDGSTEPAGIALKRGSR